MIEKENLLKSGFTPEQIHSIGGTGFIDYLRSILTVLKTNGEEGLNVAEEIKIAITTGNWLLMVKASADAMRLLANMAPPSPPLPSVVPTPAETPAA
jgi:hypothetical protein